MGEEKELVQPNGSTFQKQNLMPLVLYSLCQGVSSFKDSIRSLCRTSRSSGPGNPFKIKSYLKVWYQLIFDFCLGSRANIQLVPIWTTWEWGEAFPSCPCAHRGYLSSLPSVQDSAWVADIGDLRGGSVTGWELLYILESSCGLNFFLPPSSLWAEGSSSPSHSGGNCSVNNFFFYLNHPLASPFLPSLIL